MKRIEPMSPVNRLAKLTYDNTHGLEFDKLKLCLQCSVFNTPEGEAVLYQQWEGDEAHWRLVTKSTSQNLCAWGARTFGECREVIDKFFGKSALLRRGRHE